MFYGVTKWLVLFFLLFLAAVIGLHYLYRWIRKNAERVDPRKYDFDLGELQKLVASGQMTQDEYLKARAVIFSRSDGISQPTKGFPVLAPPQQPKEPGESS